MLYIFIDGVHTMKKGYLVPEVTVVEFEIEDIITHSIATGDESSNRNDESWDDSWNGWLVGYDGSNAWVIPGSNNN